MAAGYISLIHDRCLGLTRIGLSFVSLSRTAKRDDGMILLHIIATDDMRGLERRLQQRYADRRSHGVWFRLTWKQITELQAHRAITTDSLSSDIMGAQWPPKVHL